MQARHAQARHGAQGIGMVTAQRALLRFQGSAKHRIRPCIIVLADEHQPEIGQGGQRIGMVPVPACVPLSPPQRR